MTCPVPVSVESKLSFVVPGRRWAHSPSPSKAPGISYHENLREDVQYFWRSLAVIWCFSVSSGASVGSLRVFFFEPWLVRLSAAKSRVLAEGFPRGAPLSLQSIVSNQTRPRRLRGAWFSRLLRHPAKRRSGSILSPHGVWWLCQYTTVLFYFILSLNQLYW